MLGRRPHCVFLMECDGLAAEWEGSCEVRNRILQDKKLLHHPANQSFCQPTRCNCVDNACILKPLLRKLSLVPGWKLPHLDPLQAELTLFVEKLGVNSIGPTAVYQAAVSIKKLLGLVKRRVNRKEVTKDSIEQTCFLLSKYFVHNVNDFLIYRSLVMFLSHINFHICQSYVPKNHSTQVVGIKSSVVDFF